MGSLAFAVGGGLAGLGAGMNEIGTEQTKATRDAAILRLQNQYASERQQAGFTEQEKLQGKTQEFEHGEKEREYQVSAAAAGAGRLFEAGQQTEKLTSEEKRTHETAQSRENAALIRAAASSGNRGGAGKPEWETRAINVGYATKDDGHGKQVPDINAGPKQAMGLVNNRTGTVYNLQGNRLYPWDNDKMQSLVDPKSTNNSVKPGEIEDLLRDPLGTIPDGPNQGLRKSDVFEQAHGYLPQAFMTTSADAAQKQQQGRGFNTVNLIGGGTAQVPQATGPQAPEPPDTSDNATE
jgi:hypothetical protein